MKILLVFPPQWVPYAPYLSLPSLAAFLEDNGFRVIQKDFNVESYDIFLSKQYLNKMHERVLHRFDILQSKETLSSIQQKYYNDLFIAKALVPKIIEEIDEAKRIFRSKSDFYHFSKLSEARKTIDAALAIISVAYYPTRLDLSSFEIRTPQRSLRNIKNATQNREENPFIELYEDNLLPYIQRQKPDIIGISVISSTQLIPGLTLSRMLKSSVCKAHVVIGGSILNSMGDALPRLKGLFQDFFDSIIFYEGERPLLELVKHLQAKEGLQTVPNLIYYDGMKVHTNDVQPPEKIDSLPTPCFDGLPFHLYLSPELVLPILASRGCYWGKCAFCTHSLIYNGRYQCRDSKKVIADIRALSKKYRTFHFEFADEGISPSAIKNLSGEIIKKRVKIKCSTSVRFEKQFTEGLCSRACRAGFRVFYFGLESGCDRILNHMRKGINKQVATDVCRNAFNAGIWNHLFVFFGFPTETEAEAQETIDFLLSNKRIIRSFSISNFILSKGSAVARNPGKYGVSRILIDRGNDFQFTYDYKVHSGLTQKEAKEMSEEYMDKVQNEYDNNEVIKRIGQDNLLLYLSHYESSDPFLKSVLIEKEKASSEGAAHIDKTLSGCLVPEIRAGVVCDSLRFNILEIQQNIAKSIKVNVYPRKTSVIYDPGAGKIGGVTASAVEILSLCDGKSSIAQIAHRLADRYPASANVIEEDCKAFLESLVAQGFVSVKPY